MNLLTEAEPLLAAVWLAVFVMALRVTARTRTLMVAPIAAGSPPIVFFYTITYIDGWPSMDFAVAYSRIALLFMAVNLLVSLIAVCRVMCNTYEPNGRK